MLARGFAKRAVLVDADEDACALAEENARENGVDARVARGDVLDVARALRGQAGAIVCNPPYFEEGSGRARAHGASARIGDVDRFVRATRELLGRSARAHFVYPAHNLARLFRSFRDAGLEPKRLRFVHATPAAAARVALVTASASKPGGLVVDAPLIERAGPKHADYSDEMRAILGIAAR